MFRPMTIAFAMLALAACAHDNAPQKTVQQPTTSIARKSGNTIIVTVNDPPSQPAPDSDKVAVFWTLPSHDWTRVESGDPRMMTLLINTKTKAQVTFTLAPSSFGTPVKLATTQREVMATRGIDCDQIVAAKDGSQAGYTAHYTDEQLKLLLKGKTSFRQLKERPDAIVRAIGWWPADVNDAMLHDYDAIVMSLRSTPQPH